MHALLMWILQFLWNRYRCSSPCTRCASGSEIRSPCKALRRPILRRRSWTCRRGRGRASAGSRPRSKFRCRWQFRSGWTRRKCRHLKRSITLQRGRSSTVVHGTAFDGENKLKPRSQVSLGNLMKKRTIILCGVALKRLLPKWRTQGPEPKAAGKGLPFRQTNTYLNKSASLELGVSTTKSNS